MGDGGADQAEILRRENRAGAGGLAAANALVMAGVNGDGSVERATPRTLWLGLRLR